MKNNNFNLKNYNKTFLFLNYRHISTIHTDQKEIKCQICDKGLLNTASLNAHIKRVHEKIANYSCDLCEKTFYQSCQLQTHKRVAHEGQRDFECDFCQRAYSTLGNLKKHIQNIHDGMKIHKCNLCNKASNKKNLTKILQHSIFGSSFSIQHCASKFTDEKKVENQFFTSKYQFQK